MKSYCMLSASINNRKAGSHIFCISSLFCSPGICKILCKYLDNKWPRICVKDVMSPNYIYMVEVTSQMTYARM